MSQPRFVDRLDLAAVVTAVNCSRVFTKLTLTKWGASAILDDALLITSELVTNAVKATGVMEPSPSWSRLGKLNLVGVRLLGFNASIVIEVWDSAPCTPAVKGEDLGAESGRGLHIVAEIAHRWGFYPMHRTRAELTDTVRLVHDLWDLTDRQPGTFRASVFEFRPYPGTPEWSRLIAAGRYTTDQLLDYAAIDLTGQGVDEPMRQRDEFNFSVGIQFGEPTLAEIRQHLVDLSHEQHARTGRPA